MLLPQAPELNSVEIIWQYWRGNKLADRLYDNDDDIVYSRCHTRNQLISAPDVITSITVHNGANVSE